jgi:hypothetical protein
VETLDLRVKENYEYGILFECVDKFRLFFLYFTWSHISCVRNCDVVLPKEATSMNNRTKFLFSV